MRIDLKFACEIKAKCSFLHIVQNNTNIKYQKMKLRYIIGCLELKSSNRFFFLETVTDALKPVF